jgi:hypothetical protein
LYEFAVVVVSEVVFDGEVTNVVFVSVDKDVVCLPVWSVESVYDEVTTSAVVFVKAVCKVEVDWSDTVSGSADFVCVEVFSVTVVPPEIVADPVISLVCDIEDVAVSVVKIDAGPVCAPPEDF